jgi:succinate-semialdehyde dehydrogenase/glutarate-semialdehyde dehydrogenase
MTIESRNPATAELIERFSEASDAALAQTLERSDAAFGTWRRAPLEERCRLLAALADVLDERRDLLALIATEEMGKTIGSARAEVEKCAAACRHFADESGEYLAPEPARAGTGSATVIYRPIGAVLAIMPWNFPYWQAVRCAAPAVASGNVVLMKHAPNVPRSALALEAAFADAGFPQGVFANLFLSAERTEALIAHPSVAAVSLTGSERAGSSVGAAAGRAIKKAVLELGGSDPFIVMPSADLDTAVATAVRARMQNNGQSCIAAKRFIVHADIHDRFVEAFRAQCAGLTIGDPADEDTALGPLALPGIRDGLKDQVARSIEAGATLLYEGDTPDGPGYWFPPVILGDIPEGAPARREELFGPVASMFRVESLDEAIGVANETPFGLGAAAFTESEDEQNRLIEDLDAGMVFINAMVASDPAMPFGGVKRSGFGRELWRAGAQAFANVKTVVTP